jgi:hypothetical protein
MLIQHGANIQVRSLSESNRLSLIMDLTQNGAVITGTWSERTNPSGYYQGSVYHGAIQFLLDPTGHRMRGQWVGVGQGLGPEHRPVDPRTRIKRYKQGSHRTAHDQPILVIRQQMCDACLPVDVRHMV